MENLVFYMTLNYPTQSGFFKILDILEKYHVGYVEIGIPVDNPYLEGTIIRDTHKHVLNVGLTFEKIEETLRAIRKCYSFKVILMTYNEGVETYRLEYLDHRLYDAILCVDKKLDKTKFAGIVHIFDNQQSRDELLELIEESKPFAYVLSGKGKTGQFASVPTEYISTVQAINYNSDTLPFVGFGIKTPEDVENVMHNGAKGAIIGTEFIKRYLENGLTGVDDYLSSFKDRGF